MLREGADRVRRRQIPERLAEEREKWGERLRHHSKISCPHAHTHQSLTVSSQEAERKQSRRTTFQETEYTSWRCSSRLLSGFACGGADKSHTCCGEGEAHARCAVLEECAWAETKARLAPHLHGAVSRGGNKYVLVVLAPAAVVQPVGGVKGPDLTHGAAAGRKLRWRAQRCQFLCRRDGPARARRVATHVEDILSPVADDAKVLPRVGAQRWGVNDKGGKQTTTTRRRQRVTARHLRGGHRDAVRQEGAKGDGVAVELGAVDRHGARCGRCDLNLRVLRSLSAVRAP